MSASTPAGAVLEFKLLGPPAIELDGRPLRFARKKTAALLFYLAGTARPLPRDKAAALLWPEYAPDHARANLRGAMLDAERAAGTSLFPVGADPVGFVAGLELRVDAAVFESRVREALGDGGLCKESGIEEALALYRGGFLEGFFLKDAYEFEEWQLLREAHYRNLAVRGLAARGRLLLETGRFEEADVKARAIIAIAPLDEMGHALLSEILAACGDAEGARAQYHLFADLLDRELGSEPSPSYAALCESIQNRRFKPASRQKRLLRASLPSWADSFIGRAADLERIAAALESSRFATIAGPGGSGKTRLAVEAAAVLVPGFRGGACFLDFSACGREELMAAAARGLGLPPISRETPAGLASRLGNAEMLIIMDNCERVAGECAALASALAGVCPGVKLLATSIQPLGAPGESVFFIDTLPVPGPYDLAETIMQSPAVTLFVDRMRGPHARVWNVEDSQALGLIARRLGGLPLAIELAAARARAYPLKALAQTLADALDLEAGYGQRLPDRQRTLERVIAWSWALLNAEERRCAEILSVFESGFDAEAFEAVLGCPAMAVVPQLADKSIVVPDARGLWPPRWRFLEPVRTYAGARLSASDAATAAFPAHAAYYLGLAERIGAGLSPARGTGALAALMTEWPNIAAACRYSMSREHRASALRALMELRRFFLVEDRIADLEPLIAAVDPCSLSGAEERAAYEELSSLCSWFDLDRKSVV